MANERKIIAATGLVALAIVAAGVHHAIKTPGAASASIERAALATPTRTPVIRALVHSYDGAQTVAGPGVFHYSGGLLTLEMTPRSTDGVFRGGFERARP